MKGILRTLIIGAFVLRTCTVFGQSIFLTEIGAGKIDSTDIGGMSQAVFIDSLSAPYGIAFEQDSGRVYWTEVTKGQIWRSDRDGLHRQLLLDSLSLPRGITLDEVVGKMYWVENGSKKIREANLDGTSVKDILTVGLSAPTQIAVDPTHAKLYWTDDGGEVKHIGMCGVSGGNASFSFVDSTSSFVSGIFVDAIHSRVYWTEYGPAKRIRSSNLDGSNVTTIDTFVTSDPRGILVIPNSGKILWTDYLSDQVESASLTGAADSILASGLNNPLSICGSTGTEHGLGVPGGSAIPESYYLYQNYPNPFNPSTTIRFDLDQPSTVTMDFYNVLGEKIGEWNYGRINAGEYNKAFNLSEYPSGVYFYRLAALGATGNNFVSVKKFVLIK